jgi:hypothetical protein
MCKTGLYPAEGQGAQHLRVEAGVRQVPAAHGAAGEPASAVGSNPGAVHWIIALACEAMPVSGNTQLVDIPQSRQPKTELYLETEVDYYVSSTTRSTGQQPIPFSS